MTERTRRRGLLAWLVAPVLATPVLAVALMEYGPERSFIFAGYLLVWGLTFLVAGLVVANRRPHATSRIVLARAAAWATVTMIAAFAILVALSFLFIM